MASKEFSDNPVREPQEHKEITKLKTLLKSKDDTERFVGLALLKSLLDNTPAIRNDEAAVRTLWSHIPPRFLDRLLRTGSSLSNANAKDMLDIGVSILYTFSILLPAADTAAPSFTARIPSLVAAALYSTGETTGLLLQTLYTLVNSGEGADVLMQVEDTTPLSEIATSHAMVLDIFGRAWLHRMAGGAPGAGFAQKVDAVIQSLAVLFKGTDGVTYLAFMGNFLHHSTPEAIPKDPKWISATASYIQRLVASRPTPEARAAYTSAAAGLLQAYPEQASELLFKDPTNTEKPFGYLFINLLLIDIRSSIPTLLASLNAPDYHPTAKRLAAAYDIVCLFISFLVRSLEDDSLDALIMPPDSLLRLRKGIAETMSVTVEYVRDRWDAARSGAMGFDPSARAAKAETHTGAHHALTWDTADAGGADEDAFLLSALRALTLWLREDENEQLREEGTGLVDVLMELFINSPTEKLDFRPAVLVGLEGLVAIRLGRAMFLQQSGWAILTGDLVNTLHRHREVADDREATMCVDIVRILLAVAEAGKSTQESWLDLVTGVAAWDVPAGDGASAARDAHVAVLQLCCTVLAQANPGLRSRYRHSIAAIAGIATQIHEQVGHLSEYSEQMDDVIATLDKLR
ncbi:hypothetical protein A9K55_008426 [Cordyceps militaris]|uniref:Uncharacterized protein n=1 Tax=Cordyceps militaris TaxID=73501 RepID=A0A2H4SFU3_CORMI|nr:hypothetical protein A9K55_008426 [Cordyceps militaris]